MRRLPRGTSASRVIPALGIVLLAAIYLGAYVHDPAVPGNHSRFPLGWWGWWDQSQYLRSARALEHAEFAPSLHWYPLGYSLLGVPFLLLSSLHPYLLPDLFCLLGTYAAFRIVADTARVGQGWTILLFLLATCASATIREVWAEPWNSSLSCVLIWWLLALTARPLADAVEAGSGHPAQPSLARPGRFAVLGALAGLIVLTRPTDGLLVAIWGAGTGLCLLRLRALRWSDPLVLAGGALMVLVPGAALWLRIYGPHPSEYMLQSRALGFLPGTLGWKTYLLLVTPSPWFPAEPGIVQRLPWVLPGLAGMLALPWITRGATRMLLGLLTLMIVAYAVLFLSYVDLLPSGLWRYHNIHYFKWVLPGLALLGFVLLRALLVGPRRPAALSLLLVLLLCDLRLRPRPIGVDQPAWMIQLPGPVPGWESAYFSKPILHDARGTMLPIRDFRALPDRQGWRLIALSRPFSRSLTIGGLGHWPDGPVSGPGSPPGAQRWGWSLGLRLPGYSPEPEGCIPGARTGTRTYGSVLPAPPCP